MSKLLIKDKEIVIPGQVLAEGMDFLPSGNEVFREGESLIATKVGLVTVVNDRFVKVIPLTGKYVPKSGDLIIGNVTNVLHNGWRVNFGWNYEAFIPLKDGSSDYIQKDDDLTKYFNFGDYVMAQITHVKGRTIDLSMKGPGLRKLSPGRLVNISSPKVPRVIGKQGSMISMLKEHTGCRISVGQNGIIWLCGEDPKKELLAVEAIRLIEKESHKSGLTDKIKEFLEKKK